MQKLELAKTVDTPQVSFDPTNGQFHVEGESYPENALDFYGPVFESLNQYIEMTNGPITAHFKLSYFNSSSSKCLLDIFDILEAFHSVGGKVTVNWYYQVEDEDIKESGEDFADDLSLNFSLVSFE
ncbi:DUF1987 domain-containing protein [Sulfidibacter corallicola]|uniref:DUF1987 domain-containing protein n=1 Tax=Sulfidibacter corallicola TaxID=2818388 RepID=A0A8A4TU59_SULCO|nr:DUF1987 domain-containing protein [Sulfidibacter corallicola]QTD52674.1 DUF1987 domain-containing protein [Sulfidibacter corallicola]